MSYFSKWKRNGPASVQPVVPRGRSQSLGVDALERSGIRSLEQYVSVFFVKVFTPHNVNGLFQFHILQRLN